MRRCDLLLAPVLRVALGFLNRLGGLRRQSCRIENHA
jgi:hypothetical protein